MAASLLVSLALIPFVLQYLSGPEYGIFAIATDLLGWLSVANLGITAVFNSKGAQLIGKQDLEELNIVASTTFFAQLGSSLSILLIGIILANHPGLVFGETQVDRKSVV